MTWDGQPRARKQIMGVRSKRSRKPLHIALVYNAASGLVPETPEDRGSMADLLKMIRHMSRAMRSLGHRVTILPLADDLFVFHRKLLRLNPDVVFNQYDDVVHGVFDEMLFAAIVQMMGFRVTGSPALALGLSRYKHTTSRLLQGLGIPIPPCTEVLEKVSEVDRHEWRFPLIVQPCHEDAGIGLNRNSVVRTKTALRNQVRHVLQEFKQPAIVQCFLPGREFNVGIVGGKRLRRMPLAEVCYHDMPPEIPPIMSYAAKWLENTTEYKKTSILCPTEVEPQLAEQLYDIALRAFRAVGAWGYGRVDIRLDEEGVPRVLEVNCNASLEHDIGLARAAKKAGISYPELLQMVIDAAMEDAPHTGSAPMQSLVGVQ